MAFPTNHPHTVIVIAGPTAVGKTAFAIKLAKQFNTSIISADSRQCFRELNIGVAKPSAEELAFVQHYFIDSHSIQDKVDASVYENYALYAAGEIFKSRPIAIMVGGTGMYIKAFCEGLDMIPPVDISIQQFVRTGYDEKGLAWLQQEVKTNDPAYFETGETQNPQRLMRALEVKLATGNSIRFYQNKQPIQRPFNIVKIGLELPRPILNERIHQRVDIMMKDGLLEEVKALVPYQQLNALQTVGYKEIFDYLNGISSVEAAVEFIKINTRQYAKRQMTWFKKDQAFQWFEPTDKMAIIDYLSKWI